MSSSDRKPMPLLVLGLLALALIAFWYLGRRQEMTPDDPKPLPVAPPETIEVAINLDGEECKFSAHPDLVTLYKVGTDAHPNAGTWQWVDETHGYEVMWLVLKGDGLGSCLPFQNFPNGKRGFEIPRGGTEPMKVKNDAACKVGEYSYGLLARHEDGTFLECDPRVKILD